MICSDVIVAGGFYFFSIWSTLVSRDVNGAESHKFKVKTFFGLHKFFGRESSNVIKI